MSTLFRAYVPWIVNICLPVKQSGRSLQRFGVPFQVVEYGLPPPALLFWRVHVVWLERFDDLCASGFGDERGGHFAAVVQSVIEMPVRNDPAECSREIESGLAVAGFHAVTEPSAGAQVVFGVGRDPVIRGMIPLRDMFGHGEALPDLSGRGGDERLDGDRVFHDSKYFTSPVSISIPWTKEKS